MRGQNRKKWRRPKNRFARSAKYSEYKTLQLVECFARDLSIQDSARLTKMTERTVRDRYADLRAKLLPWCLDKPDLFGGLGHVLLDADGTLNIHVLEMLLYYSQSNVFKQRMKQRYPKFKTEKDPALNHVMEMLVKRFTSVNLPKVDEDFSGAVQNIFAAARAESQLSHYAFSLPERKTRLTYWKSTTRRLNLLPDQARKFPDNHGITLFRDLKYILKYDPF
ncbi:MAG: hypothetical protein AB2765_07870 [Candidatus Thiodiazotropha endolucinida]